MESTTLFYPCRTLRRTGPSALTLKAIADVLEVTTDYLLGTGDASIKDTALLRQFKEVDNMPEDSKNAIIKVLNAYIRDFNTQKAYAH